MATELLATYMPRLPAASSTSPSRRVRARPLLLASVFTLIGVLVLVLVLAPGALADNATKKVGFTGGLPFQVGLNSVWVILAAILVMVMQAGFAALEIGLGRGKNAGAVVAKVLTNFSIVVLGVITIDKRLDDPVGSLPAHGLAGVWGALSCGLFQLTASSALQPARKPGGPVLHRQARPARRPGPGGSGHVRLCVRHLLGGLLADPTDHRPAREPRRRRRGAGHLRARDVWVPGAVHTRIRARRLGAMPSGGLWLSGAAGTSSRQESEA